MNFKNKLILIFLLSSVILGGEYAQPNQASASGFAGITTADIPRIVAYIKTTIVRVMARELLNMLSNKIVDTIQKGGRDNGPAFVQNWRNFITDAQYRGEDIFKTILASTPVCGYLNKSIKDAFRVTDNQNILFKGNNIRVGDLDPFNLRAACTLPSGFNMDAYRNDFAGNGGWDAWSRLLEPQNNYYGLMLSSLDELAKQRDLSQAADLAESATGSGYTSIRGGCQDTPKDPNFVGPTMPAYSARCSFMGQVFTPGDLLGKSVASSIDSEFKGIISSTEIADLAVDIIGAVVSRISNLGGDAQTDPTVDKEVAKFSYVEEYCTAKKPSGDAVNYVNQNYPDLANKFPTQRKTASIFNPLCTDWKINNPVMYELKCVDHISYCTAVNDAQNPADNPYPQMNCTVECMKLGGAYALPVTPSPVSTLPSALELAVCKGTRSGVAAGGTNPYVGAFGANCTVSATGSPDGPNTCLTAYNVKTEQIRETSYSECVPDPKTGIWPANNTACQQAMQKICRVSFCAHTKESSTWWGWNDRFPEVNPDGNFYNDRTVPAKTVAYFCQNNLGWWGFKDSRFLPKDQTICSSTDSNVNGFLGDTVESFTAKPDNPLV